MSSDKFLVSLLKPKSATLKGHTAAEFIAGKEQVNQLILQSHKTALTLFIDQRGMVQMNAKLQVIQNEDGGMTTEVNGNTSNVKWSPMHLVGALIKMHVGVVKASNVPDFAVCARSKKLATDDLSGQSKFKGRTLNIYIMSNYALLPHGKR